jgi:hypothetical protein
MGRRRSLSQVFLPLLLAVSGPSFLGGCADEPDGPVAATLVELMANQEAYDDRLVQTGGIVRRFGAAEGATRLHYVVEDGRANRVAIVPNHVAERYTGQEVTVAGVFHFNEQEGRTIEITRIDQR